MLWKPFGILLISFFVSLSFPLSLALFLLFFTSNVMDLITVSIRVLEQHSITEALINWLKPARNKLMAQRWNQRPSSNPIPPPPPPRHLPDFCSVADASGSGPIVGKIGIQRGSGLRELLTWCNESGVAWDAVPRETDRGIRKKFPMRNCVALNMQRPLDMWRLY